MNQKQIALVKKVLKQNLVNVFAISKTSVTCDCFYSELVTILERAFGKRPGVKFICGYASGDRIKYGISL